MTRLRATPRQLTEEVVLEFQQKAAELFTPTRPVDFHEFEKGLYGVLYVKPIKRVARLLTSDRELLALVTTFPDQQPRTIETAIQLIDETEGRLEHTIAIIVHRDVEGNGKLKVWGREQGLTVIPVYAGAEIPSGPELERSLLQEFYSHDPFDVTGPVSDDSRFFGRRTEAQDIARQLQKGQVRACLGIRKIGKTSILNRVLAESRVSHGSITAMVDCSRDSVWDQDAGSLLACIADAISRATTAPDRYAEVGTVTPCESVTEGHGMLLRATRSAPAPVIVCFDEVDYITPGSPTAPDRWRAQFNPFWRNLRAAYQETSRSGTRLSLLLSGVSSKWFRVEAIDEVENAALAFVPEEYLSPLATGASVAMIKNIAKSCGLQFDSQTGEMVADACSNVPYWVRKACSFIHRSIEIEERPYQLKAEEVDSLLETFLESEGAAIAQVALGHLFRVYPELKQMTIDVAAGVEPRPNPMLAAVLVKYGVLVRKESSLRLAGRMMVAGMKAYMDASVESPERPSVQFPSINEWADELALLNARRNQIEKRLRFTAVNFIRFAALQNRQGGSLLERVSKVVDDKRRQRLRHLSADELIEKFNWADLVALIEREWELFRNVFSDKKAFSDHAKVVNERFDAHAKDADKVDVALYRRSLDWFEDCMSRA